MKRLLSIGLLVTALCFSGSQTLIYGQNDNFDLSSQRSEKQDVNSVTGQKKDHRGININPTPHSITYQGGGTLDFSQGFKVKDNAKKFENDLNGIPCLKGGKAKLTVSFGAHQAAKHEVKPISGAYRLQVTHKGVHIIGYDERGAFYGLQTLRQLILSPVAAQCTLPAMTILDYPDLPNRGVVEGFYGTPWSHEVRLSLIDFYGQFKMNTYIYGPKDDPYHSSPNWRLPYPDKEAAQIKELVNACRKNRVSFVWAIHPGKDIKWNEEDYKNLVHKFELMYELGIRDFAIFFDDISGEGTNPNKQTELLNKLTEDFVLRKGDVSPLTVCPTDYSRLWANPTEQGSLAIYGRTLKPEIKVFWTGDVVCSDLTRATMEFINKRIKRPAYYWWNFPVTDYARNYLLQGPVYGLDTTLTDADLCGIVSNPMEHGEASKLALYGVADYSWNVKAYNAVDNWERGLRHLMPDAAEAYRTFAMHSADTETGYRRQESWETETYGLEDQDTIKAEKLLKEFERIQQSVAKIEEKCQNKQLLEELRPWLTEQAKLGKRGAHAIKLMNQYHKMQDPAAFWSDYITNIMSADDIKNYQAHKSGTMKLQPFYQHAMDDMGFGFLKQISGHTPKEYKGIGSFASAKTIQTKAMTDGDSTTYYTSGMSQKSGDWIGLDLRDIRTVSEIHVMQGRNSVDDVDYFDHAALQYSTDGEHWVTLLDDMRKQYDIRWQGKAVEARYVRLLRLDSQRNNYASIRVFDINPQKAEELPVTLDKGQEQVPFAAFDGNHETYCKAESLCVNLKPGDKSVIILSNNPDTNITCTLIDRKGKILSTTQSKNPYTLIKLNGKNNARLKLSGKLEITEIIIK